MSMLTLQSNGLMDSWTEEIQPIGWLIKIFSFISEIFNIFINKGLFDKSDYLNYKYFIIVTHMILQLMKSKRFKAFKTFRIDSIWAQSIKPELFGNILSLANIFLSLLLTYIQSIRYIVNEFAI